MFYNGLYTLFRHKYLIFVLLFWGCSSDAVIENDPDEVVVTFSTGNSVASRTAFEENTPVKVWVYSRSGGTPNYSVTPYKTADGKTAGSGVLSTVTFTDGDLTPDKSLTVRRDRTYDFIAVVNASTSNFGTFSSGSLTGFSHGMDILSGRKSKLITTTTAVEEIKFTEYGADNEGNLPHLCSAVYTKLSVTGAVISEVGAGNLQYAVSGMYFKECLPESADFSFSSDPMALTVKTSGYNTSYLAPAASELITVNTTSDVAESENGILLPCPLRYLNRMYNIMNIEFHLVMDDVDIIFYAPEIQVPEFKPGHRYGFIIELDKDVIRLKLSVEPWSSVSWETGMGEEGSIPVGLFPIGSWSSVSWNTGMGENGSVHIPVIGGWSGIAWTSEMGGN
jgi:hypothetical protein